MNNRIAKPLLAAAIAGALSSAVVHAAPITFRVGSASPAQQIAQVESNTDFETFTGRTDRVTGTITFDPARRTGSGTIEVDVASIDTGIPLRNEHMRDRSWLDAKQFPTIRFRVTNVRHTGGDRYQVTGDFTMKGVTRRITTMATVRHRPESEATRRAGFRGDVLQVQAAFPVRLADHNVTLPPPAVGKVAETVRVSVTVFAQSGV
ncbi:MAG: YceI family protein [Fimbriimonadaceae bacterium]